MFPENTVGQPPAEMFLQRLFATEITYWVTTL